jgi:muramoyltetrapeptide carboxypeptidase
VTGPLRILITTASGVVPMGELDSGVARLTGAGCEVHVQPGVNASHFVFAGDDESRARRFWEAAWSESADVLWCARGGYGAARILPMLERFTLEDGTPPPKLLCGFSDVTALHEFVRSRWGWSALHCAMPGGISFSEFPEPDFKATLALARRDTAAALAPAPRWADLPLTSFGPEPLIDLDGTLVGGNLTVLASLAGTPFAPDNAGGRFLFLEDVSEAPYRIDRALNQLHQAGAFRGVRAVLLGTFHDCNDTPPTTGPQKTPIRAKFSEPEWMRHVFGTFSLATRIPVLRTLPCGHGPDKVPLPLGARYTLSGAGHLRLVHWDWLSR